MPTASQIIAALVEKIGGGSVVLTMADVTKWGTKYPTLFEADEAGTQITVSISPETIIRNRNSISE